MAKLAAVVDSLDTVPETYRNAYIKADDGRYVLQLDGAPRGFVDAARLNEFRDNNRNLQAELAKIQEALKQYEGLDPKAAREALEERKRQEEALRKKELLRAEEVEQRIHAAIEPLAKQIEAERKARADAERTLAERALESEIVSVARRAGELQPGAEDVLVSKARAAGWQLHDGHIVQMANGAPVYSNKRPGEYRSLDEWIAEEAGVKFGWVWKATVGAPPPGTRSATPPGVNDPRDREAFRKNLADIASGKKKVGPLT